LHGSTRLDVGEVKCNNPTHDHLEIERHAPFVAPACRLNPASPILQIRNLGKTYPGVRVLDGVNLDLRRGEVHILLGENGAGKSTLAKILSGACRKTDGEILLDGQAVEIKNPKHAQELGVSIIYQELNLVPQLTVAENIFLGREPMSGPGVIADRALATAARALLDDLGLPIGESRRVQDLGIAQQQMVEVAKALSLKARILIMDEPTSALTHAEIRELFKAIARLKAAGVSIIYISHRLEELIEIGDRVTVLRDGKSVATREIREVTIPDLIRLMVDRDLREQFPKKKAPVGDELLRVEDLNQEGFLHHISFQVRAGEVVGISGLVGSGRSRLARAIFGAERIDSGRIVVNGKTATVKSPRQAIDLGIGFLPEDRRTAGLVLKLSVRENICLSVLSKFCRWGTVRSKPERLSCLDYVQQLRIKAQNLEQPVLYLSGGNQQKVVLSKWLCSQAKLFVFDEPTRGIDVGAKVEIYELMNRLTATGAAILMISSDMPEVLGMSDRILTMCRGAISGEFNAGEVSQEKLMASALGVN
jgi:ribose transport system ATP-binding protein